MIQVLIAEDHTLVRAGIRALLEKARDVKVIGEASNGQEAVNLTQKHTPDVLVMDIMMPRLNGIQAAEKIRGLKLSTKILLLSMYSDAGLVHQALKSGITGYILKSSVSDELLKAVYAVANNETYLTASISNIVIKSAINPPPKGDVEDPFSQLSPREKEILQLIAEEYTSSEIAKLLFISEKTVEKHRTSLSKKLNVRNMAGLARMAVKYGLVDNNL